MAAYVGIAPIAGAFADRLPRRALLVALDIVKRAASALALPFVSEIWQLFVLIFVLQSASAAFTPTFQATIPDVLPEESRYTRALSLSRLAYDLENIFSPTLAALLLDDNCPTTPCSSARWPDFSLPRRWWSRCFCRAPPPRPRAAIYDRT